MAATSALTLGSVLAAPALSLEDYLGQVNETNPGLKAANTAGEGFALMSEGAGVITLPYLFGNYTDFNDRQETANPPFQGDRTEGSQYTLGVSANTPIGLQAKYSFNSAYTNLVNATAIPLRNYYTSYNKVELVQPLVKNGFGSQTRAQRDAIESKNLAQSFGNRYSAMAQLVQAENAYWRLAFARRGVEVQKDVLARASRVLGWAKRRVGLQLGDKADLLQAQTAYDLRRIELMSAQEEERNAARSFNLLRRRENSSVNEELKIPSIDATIAIANPDKEGTRLDVLAAEQEKRATVAAAQLDKEALKPSVDLFANIAWTGRDAKRPEAVSEAFGSKRSNISYGLNFSVPLAVPAVVRSLRGNNMTQEAAEYTLEQKKLDEGNEWIDIQGRLADAKARLSLLKSIEGVQKEKYENENQRLLRGRTTTYQALTFEQDYAATQLSTLRTQNQVLALLAQMKLFRGEQ